MSLEINSKLNNFSYDEEEDEMLSSNEELLMNNQESPVSETETDSSDELAEQNTQYDEEPKDYDYDEHAVDTTAHEDEEQPQVTPQTQQMYQQNCLAAAQMMQLMCSSSGSASTSSSIDHTSHQVSPSGLTENEKENIPICKYCNKVFANFSNLNHHISAIHLNQSKWVCSQCGKVNIPSILINRISNY